MIEFNLVPKNLRQRSRTAVNWLRVGMIVAAALTLLSVSGSVLNRMGLAMYMREFEEQRATVQRVENLERQLRDVRRENQQLVQELERLQSLGDGGDSDGFLAFLNGLSAVTTDGILLELIEYSRGGSMLVAGVGISPEEVSRYFESVRRLHGVQDAALSQLHRASAEDDALRWFELRLRWQAGG